MDIELKDKIIHKTNIIKQNMLLFGYVGTEIEKADRQELMHLITELNNIEIIKN